MSGFLGGGGSGSVKNAITCLRSASAYQRNPATNVMTSKAVYNRRTELLTSGNFPTRTLVCADPLGLAPLARKILHYSLPGGSDEVVIKDLDNPSAESVLATTSEMAATMGYANPAYPKFYETSTGVWFLGCYDVGDDTGEGFTVWRSTDQGATWARSVIDGNNNVTLTGAQVQSFLSDGDKVYFGSYQAVTLPTYAGNYARIYESVDGGLTFTTIYNSDDIVCHTHRLTFAPNNTNIIYATFGDGSTSPFVKLEKGNGAWTSEVITISRRLGDGVLITSDSNKLITNGGVTGIFDLTTKLVTDTLYIPIPDEGNAEYRYKYAPDVSASFAGPAMRTVGRLSNGTIVGCVFDYGTKAGSEPYWTGNGGLYLSADEGRTWTCAYRMTTADRGVHEYLGELDGKIYVRAVETASTTSNGYSFPLPVAKSVRCIRQDSQIPNALLMEADATFTDRNGNPSPGQWRAKTTRGKTPTVIAVNDGVDNCLKITTVADDYANYVTLAYRPSDILGKNPVQNVYYTYRCKVKASAGYSRLYAFQLHLAGINAGVDTYSCGNIELSTEWQDCIVTGKYTSAPSADNSTPKISISASSTDPPVSLVSFDVFVKDVQVILSDTPLWDTDSQNIQNLEIGTNCIKADQVATGTFTGTNGAPSVGTWATMDTGTVAPQSDGDIDFMRCTTRAATTSNYKTGTLATICDTPADNDLYYLLRFSARSANFPTTATLGAFLDYRSGYVESATCNNNVLTPQWAEYINAGKITGALDTRDYFNLRISDSASTIFSFDVDDVEIYFSTTPLWCVPGTTTTPAKDVVVASLATSDITTLGSLCFDWRGKPSKEWGFAIQGDTPRDGVIATIQGTSGYIQILWDDSEGKFSLTDGTHTVSTAVTYTRRHFDKFRFILTYNGTEATLHVIDPVNGQQTIGVSGGVVITMPLVNLWLGSDTAQTAATLMPGYFWNLKTWNTVLSADEITDEILSAGVGFASVSAIGYNTY